ARGIKPAPMPFVDGLRATRVLRWAKRIDDAKARFSALVPEGEAEERLARFERAELHHAEGQHAVAARLFRALHDERPGEPGAEGFLRLAARSLKAMGEPRRAAETYLLADRTTKQPARSGRDLWRAGELFAEAKLPRESAA